MTLDIITHETLAPMNHGFFTRVGGVSDGIYAGLNCGIGSNDVPQNVTKNRALVAAALGHAPDALASVYQIHSPTVHHITPQTAASKPKGDAMVTNQTGVVLGILVADCAPVLFADPVAGVVGAAHAGWKGAIGGVLGNTISEMETLGATRENIRAVVGPCISQKSYEVGEEFFETFLAEDDAYARFFANGSPGKYQFDLPLFCLTDLRAQHIMDANWTGHCTYSDAARFYSYRRTTHLDEPDYGRLIACITL